MPKDEVSSMPRVSTEQPVTFRDKAFKSRTFVFADGTTAPVEKSLIVATSAERIEQLERHGDFERTAAGA
ncbi:hypothetical protein B0G84_1806 [Paraburkholderia sp. BL8N3]|nr:hypothetical protein [Paraburkholderia sp. BL8N3]TCK43470.1 hypothetical protein B0G84_1806 [Paraburkholderia sp. BL8N3]